MGILNKFGNGNMSGKGIFDKLIKGNQEDSKTEELDRIIKASDRGEEWAHEKFDELWKQYENDPNWLPKICNARIRIYQSDAQNGDKMAQYWLGVSLRHINKQQALKWLVPLAEEGSIDAIKAIAGGYTEFGGFGEDEGQYLYWYKKAAEAGDAEAQASVGLEYMASGDYREARKWYQMAADQKYSKGLLGLAQCYERKKDDEEFQAMQEGLTAEKKKILESRRRQYEQRVEELRLEALNCAEQRSDFAEAAHDIGHFYSRMLTDSKKSQTEKEDLAKRAAYFLYNSYLEGENEYDLKRFREVVQENRIHVDIQDIEQWARREIPGLFS